MDIPCVKSESTLGVASFQTGSWKITRGVTTFQLLSFQNIFICQALKFTELFCGEFWHFKSLIYAFLHLKALAHIFVRFMHPNLKGVKEAEAAQMLAAQHRGFWQICNGFCPTIYSTDARCEEGKDHAQSQY